MAIKITGSKLCVPKAAGASGVPKNGARGEGSLDETSFRSASFVVNDTLFIALYVVNLEQRANQGACGVVVVSHPLSMREILRSISLEPQGFIIVDLDTVRSIWVTGHLHCEYRCHFDSSLTNQFEFCPARHPFY